MKSLYRGGYANVLEDELERYGLQVAALQEIRWPEVGKCETAKGVIYYSGRNDDIYRHGVGVCVSERAYRAVKSLNPLNKRNG